MIVLHYICIHNVFGNTIAHYTIIYFFALKFNANLHCTHFCLQISSWGLQAVIMWWIFTITVLSKQWWIFMITVFKALITGGYQSWKRHIVKYMCSTTLAGKSQFFLQQLLPYNNGRNSYCMHIRNNRCAWNTQQRRFS